MESIVIEGNETLFISKISNKIESNTYPKLRAYQFWNLTCSFSFFITNQTYQVKI